MRLIDANELVKAIENENPGLSISGAVEKFARIAQVNMQPTIKAIPIEWLNKRAEEIAFAYWTNARNKMTLPLNELPLLIDQIIGEWEKENE